MATRQSPRDLEEALHRDDPIAMSKFASDEELERMKRAEEVLELRAGRVKRNHRFATIGQAMVGYIALAGFFANAYQTLSNKKQADARAAEEKERWEKEFLDDGTVEAVAFHSDGSIDDASVTARIIRGNSDR